MNNRFIYFFYFICIITVQVSCKTGIGLPDLKETYGGRDTKPFGGYIAKGILQNSFPGNNVQTIKEPFAKNNLTADTASVYFCASRNLFVNQTDVEAIMNYVFAGNTVFLSAAYFDSILLNKIYCKVVGAGIFTGYLPGSYQDTYTKLIEVVNSSKDSFGYYYNPLLSYFSEINDRYGRVVGYNTAGKPNCIVFWWGKGKLFLHSDPRVFSNYFLLSKNNYRYMQELMQVTQAFPDHVYWDEYYNKLNRPRKSGESNSTLSELFKHPPLKAAFWLLLLMLLFYIIFGGKRRQRIIREIKPNQNSSVAFTETIARLYLQKHDNKSIADKMITYFNEFIRNNYYLNNPVNNKDLIVALSRKSGISEEKTSELFSMISKINEANEMDDHQLLSLDAQIQQFYKKKK